MTRRRRHNVVEASLDDAVVNVVPGARVIDVGTRCSMTPSAAGDPEARRTFARKPKPAVAALAHATDFGVQHGTGHGAAVRVVGIQFFDRGNTCRPLTVSEFASRQLRVDADAVFRMDMDRLRPIGLDAWFVFTSPIEVVTVAGVFGNGKRLLASPPGWMIWPSLARGLAASRQTRRASFNRARSNRASSTVAMLKSWRANNLSR